MKEYIHYMAKFWNKECISKPDNAVVGRSILYACSKFHVKYYLVVIINKKCVQYLRENKATVFESVQDTSVSGSEDAVVSLGSKYYSMSDTMELICQPFDGNK